MSAKPEVRVTKNGPYLVTACTVVDADGKEVELTESGLIALCACGQSKNRPKCDGSHQACPKEE